MFDVQSRYTDAVANFPFVEWKEDLELAIHPDDLNRVVKEVADKIIAASQLRQMFSTMAQKEFSLRDACYLVVQDTDKKNNLDTPAKIAGAPEPAKGIVSHVAKKLSNQFEQVTAEDLNVLTLLFGVHRICDLAQNIIIINPDLSPIEQAEADLNRLMVLRNKYLTIPLEEMTEESRLFLEKVNKQIQETTELLAALQSSQTVNQQTIQ